MVCATIAILYTLNAFSYDKFHKNYDRIYSVDAYITFFNGDRFPKEYLSASLAEALKVQAPEIDEITRCTEGEYEFINGDRKFSEKGVYADTNFFRVFTFPFDGAVSHNVLSDQNSVVISESMARKIFLNTDCIGKTLIMEKVKGNEAFKIAGVFRDVPKQSTMQFDFVIPFSKFLADNKWATETGATANSTWVLLKKNINYKMVENKIRNLIKDQESTLNQELFLFPLREHTLYSYAGGKRVWKEMQNIVIIGSIGFLILLIACFNFINLAIAMNFKRYREAGIKKAVGSSRSAIVFQMLGETLIVILISLLSAVILAKILVTGLNTISDFSIHFNIFSLNMMVFFICISIVTTLVSGLLPALYLSSSNPVDVLKGKIIASHSYSFLRQSLIVFQFIIPIVLIISMIIIKTQNNFMRNYDVGVDKDKLIILDNTDNIRRHAESVRNELLAIPGIEAVSFTNCIPTRGTKVSSEVNWEGRDATNKLHFWCVNSDLDYNKVVRVRLTEGRFFNRSFPTDSAAYLINDISATVMGNENPVGSIISVDGRKGAIIGVFSDFHSVDLAGPLVPTIMSVNNDLRPFLLVKFSSGSFPDIIGRIREVYTYYESGSVFKATLFRDLIPFSNLSLPSKIVGLAFIIAISLACMGLFGLASFNSENRTKEIGIRKANGATTINMMRLLLTNYARWLIVASFFAVPLASILGKAFLGRFHFHSSLPFMAFIAGPVIASAVALMTVIIQAWRIAKRNPVKSLRYE